MKTLGKILSIIGLIVVLVYALLFFGPFFGTLKEFRDWQGREAFIEDFNKNGSVDLKKYPFLYNKGFRSVGVTSVVIDGTPTNCMFINTNEKDPFSEEGSHQLLRLCNDGSMNFSKKYEP